MSCRADNLDHREAGETANYGSEEPGITDQHVGTEPAHDIQLPFHLLLHKLRCMEAISHGLKVEIGEKEVHNRRLKAPYDAPQPFLETRQCGGLRRDESAEPCCCHSSGVKLAQDKGRLPPLSP
jgi:hypothetical protein